MLTQVVDQGLMRGSEEQHYRNLKNRKTLSLVQR
jgi:hypothetical protein